MGKYQLKLPKMGESIAEATITKWLKDVGDNVEIDESLVEIATDKVDSDVPSEYKGKLIKKNFEVNDVVKVGEVIAEIETDMIDNDNTIIKSKEIKDEIMVEDAKDEIMVEDVKDEIMVEDFKDKISNEDVLQDIPSIELLDKDDKVDIQKTKSKSDKFYSPLVKNIAKKEKISGHELDSIIGSGKDGRVTKQDILSYVKSRSNNLKDNIQVETSSSREDQVLELDRMGKIIFDHMSSSKKISAHVQSFVEVDVSNLWDWREKYKKSFFDNEGQRLTFTPLFIDAVVKSLKDYPIKNSSVVDEKVIIKK